MICTTSSGSTLCKGYDTTVPDLNEHLEMSQIPRYHVPFSHSVRTSKPKQLWILRLEWHRSHLLSSIRLDTKQPIDPVQNDEERLRLAHVLNTRHKAGFFRRAMLQRDPHVVDGEDLVLGAVDEEQTSAVWLVERAVFEQREAVRSLALEGLDIVAVAPFVGQNVCEAEVYVSIVLFSLLLRHEIVDLLKWVL